jgi:1-acyl-sn-glycerol-3-phosphate acyltransferase
MFGRAAQWTKRWTRVTRLVLHFFRGMAIAGLLFPLQSAERRKREIEHWSLSMLDLLNIRLFLHGKPPQYSGRALMVVSNHVSFLDIFAVNAVVPSRFVAKSEMRTWPLVGWLATRSGSLFIDRSRRLDTMRIKHEVSAALKAGDVFAVFPEGTTTDGSTVLKFHASLIEPALEADAAVQPVALWYERTDGSLCEEASYSGGKSMWETLMGITSQHEIRVHVCFLDPIQTVGRHRRDIANEAREAILRTLFPQAPRSRTETHADLAAEVH